MILTEVLQGFTSERDFRAAEQMLTSLLVESGYELLHDDRDFDPFVKHLGPRVTV